MARTCTVCRHAERLAINAALVAGEPFRAIAGRLGLSRTALQRHKAEHLPLALVKATEAAQVAEADTLLAQVQEMRQRARAYEAQAVATGDLRVGLLALREERAAAELVAKMTGALRERQELPCIPVYAFDPDIIFPDPKSPPGAPVVVSTDPPLGRQANGSSA
jgi:hypothetical protein